MSQDNSKPTFEQARAALHVLQQYFAETKRIKDPDAPATEKQTGFMQRIAGALDLEFTKDPGLFTKGEAAAWIDKHLPTYNQQAAAKRGSVF